MSVLSSLKRKGILEQFLWEEKYPSQEEYPGYFIKRRESLEKMSESELFDLWLRGQSIMGYADTILHVVDGIRSARRRR